MLENFPAVAAILFTLGTATGALGLRGIDAIRHRRAADSVRWQRDGGALVTLRDLSEIDAAPDVATSQMPTRVSGCATVGYAADGDPRRHAGQMAPAGCVPPAGVQLPTSEIRGCVGATPPHSLEKSRRADAGESAPRRRVPLALNAGGGLVRLPADDHAAALLAWCAKPRPEGLAGETVTAVELIEIYSEMCAERGWEERPWQPVATAFMRRAGISKKYQWRGKQRVRVYEIPRVAPEAKSTNEVNLRAAA